MMMPIYSFLLAIAIALWALRYLVPLLRNPAGHEHLLARFGRTADAFAPVVAGKRVIWVQAVSVGEVLAATRLIAELEAALGEGWRVVVSTTTNTGQALAKEKFGNDRVFYMPLDFAFAVRRWLRVLKPDAIVLIESEIWPRMMHETRKCNIPVIVVNARVSDRSFHRSLKFRWIWSRVLRKSTLWLAQSEEDARRLVAMGAPAEKVRAAGNLKYDIQPKETEMVALLRPLLEDRKVVVAGSLLEPEEQYLASHWREIQGKNPEAVLILAPRHPNRFAEAFAIAKKIDGASVSLASELRAQAQRQQPIEKLRPKAVILLDTIGDLAGIYSLASVAFVGGSLAAKGGHNPLEPARFGVPVVMGPSFENFRDIVGKMRSGNAIRIVETDEELASVLKEFLANVEEARALGERGRQVYESQQGATARAVEAIVKLVQP